MTILLRLAVLLVLIPLASAHSVQDAETAIKEQELYAQFVDRIAPPFALYDTQGNSVFTSDLAGKVVVLNFLYTRCTEACPLHMNLIAQLQDQAKEKDLGDQVEFITVATDTEDLPGTHENMVAYGRNFAFDPENWRFLYRSTNDAPDVTRDLAEAYGLKFTEAAESVQIHGIVTHVIDQEGRMRARFHGLEFKPEQFISYLEVLVKGPSALNNSTWDEVHTYFENLFN